MKMSENNANPESSKSQSRQVILNAAEKIFAEKGYAATSIRDITSEANCNLAAVNYYFHGKDKLYLEVLSQNLSAFRKILISSITTIIDSESQSPTLELLLKAFAKAFLEPFVVGQQRLLQLIVHEMTNPILPAGIFFHEVIEPARTALLKALKQLCPKINDVVAQRCISSIIAQLIHVVHSQRIPARELEIQEPEFDLANTIDHIVCFSTAGVNACVEKKS